MNHLTADEAMCDRLFGILEPVEIRDSEGKLLGTWTPYVSPEEWAVYERCLASVDLAELKRRRETEAGKGKPLAEIIRRLEAGAPQMIFTHRRLAPLQRLPACRDF